MATQTYKKLNVGNTLRKGDEWANPGVDRCDCRRPIKAKNPSRPTYIILTQEDIIEEGDEYFDKYSEKWEKSEYVGSNPPISSPYRRLAK
jgi:hypothetical protein